MNVGATGAYLPRCARTLSNARRASASASLSRPCLASLRATRNSALSAPESSVLQGAGSRISGGVFHCHAAKRLGAAVSSFSLGILPARFEHQAAHRIIVGFPGMTVDGIRPAPIRVGTAARLLHKRFDAPRISASLGRRLPSKPTFRDVGQGIDHGAPHAGLVTFPHDRVEHRDGLFGIADGSILQRDELSDATDLLEFDRALADRKRLQAVGECILVAGEKRAGGAAIVIELCKFGGRCVAGGVASALALRSAIFASSGFSRSRIAVMSAMVRGGATKAGCTMPASCGGFRFVLRRRRAAARAACLCSSRSTQAMTIGLPTDARHAAITASLPPILAPHAGRDLRMRGFPALRDDLLVRGGKSRKD